MLSREEGEQGVNADACSRPLAIVWVTLRLATVGSFVLLCLLTH